MTSFIQRVLTSKNADNMLYGLIDFILHMLYLYNHAGFQLLCNYPYIIMHIIHNVLI